MRAQLVLLLVATALGDDDERSADEDYDEDADDGVAEAVASAAVEVTTGGSSFDALGWHDPPLVPPSEVSDEYYQKIDGATDAHMRAGDFKLGYLAMKEAIDMYPTSKRLRKEFDRVFDHTNSQPVPGEGDMYAASLFKGGVKRRDARVLQPRFNLTVMDDFVTAEEAAGLIRLRHENEHTAQPALWCLSYLKGRSGDGNGPEALRKFLPTYGLPADAMTTTRADFTGSKGQCLRPRASAHLSKLLAGKGAYSSSLTFLTGSHRAIDSIAKRIEQELGLLDAHGAPWQITKYTGRAAYTGHTDCPLNAADTNFKMDRIATVLIYLTNTKGGKTSFTHFANTAVQPVVGKAVAWRNLDHSGECMPFTEHEALPLEDGSGEKIILQRWYHRVPSMGFTLPRHAPDGVPEWKLGMNPIICNDPPPERKCRMYNEWSDF